EREPTRDPPWVEPLADFDQLVSGRGRPDLDAEWVVDTGEEIHVRAVGLPRALTDPEHVGRAVVPVARRRVAARQHLLVVEHKPFVARPDVDLVELLLGRYVDPTRGHEEERALDLGGQPLVSAALDRRGDEFL